MHDPGDFPGTLIPPKPVGYVDPPPSAIAGRADIPAPQMPSAPAQQPEPPPIHRLVFRRNIEYHIENLAPNESNEQLTTVLDGLGAEGWQLIQVSPFLSHPEEGKGEGETNRYIFFREVP